MKGLAGVLVTAANSSEDIQIEIVLVKAAAHFALIFGEWSLSQIHIHSS